MKATHYLFGLTLCAVLAIPPPARPGTIDYTFSDGHYPGAAIGRMEVDESVLARGYFTVADLIGFGFGPFGAADLGPFLLTIGPDGSPSGGGPIAGHVTMYGSNYRLAVDWPGGSYQMTTGNYPGIYGYGYWTAEVVPSVASASVPEPSGLALAVVATILVAIGVYLWRAREGGAD